MVVPVGVDQDPHLRLTRGLQRRRTGSISVTASSRGLLVSLSVHDENADVFGQMPNGRVDKAKVAAVFDQVVAAASELGFSDIMSSPKQGHVHIPSATQRTNMHYALLSFVWSVALVGWVCWLLLHLPPFCCGHDGE